MHHVMTKRMRNAAGYAALQRSRINEGVRTSKSTADSGYLLKIAQNKHILR